MMNNRITELAIQADIWCDQNIAQDAPWYNSQWERKFAELIIQDAANWIRDNYDHENAEPLAFTLEIAYGLHGDYA